MHSNSLICCYNLQVITDYLSPHDPSTTDVALGNASLGPLLGAGRLVKVGSAEGMGNLASPELEAAALLPSLINCGCHEEAREHLGSPLRPHLLHDYLLMGGVHNVFVMIMA